MRPRALIVLTCMLAAANAGLACPEAFISKLNAGQVPSAPPAVDGCQTDYVADLSRALAAFTPAHAPDEVTAVVILVRDAHRAANRRSVYARLTGQLATDLPVFVPKTSDDVFAALDTLPALAKPTVDPPPPTPPKLSLKPVLQPVSNPGFQPQPPRTNWRATTGVLVGSFILGAAALNWLLKRSKPVTVSPRLRETDLGPQVQKLSHAIGETSRQLTETVERLREDVYGKVAGVVTPDALQNQLATVHDELTQLRQLLENHLATHHGADPPPPPVPPPPRTSDPVALEHQVLGETWKHFRANRELSALLDNALRDSSWQPILDDLGKAVPDDLKPTFEGVVAPCREHSALVRKLSVVPKVISGEIDRLEVAKEVHRAREFTNLLTSAQNSSEVASRLNFRFKSWVTDTFLPFADLYLQRYQQAQMEKRQGDLQNGTDLVMQLLRIAAVEAIDITPGETPFDSSRHIGRSTTNDPRFSDGVITGVVRNGFIERGQQVLRQPEVIVNRTR